MELKLNWTNHCVLSANGNNNSDPYLNNFNFTINDTVVIVIIIVIVE